jgi:dihydroorotase
MALREAIKEAEYLYNLFEYFNNNLQLQYKLKIPIIYIDNRGAEILAKNNTFHKRTKHIHIVYHYIRDSVKNQRVILEHIDSKNNISDWLTKPINRLLYKESKEKYSLIEE